ncbi:MAG: hypothetical protein ABI972_07110 [Acidobacteriota bacterium]
MAPDWVIHPQLGYGTILPGEAEMEDELVGNRDTRSPVRNTTKLPYRWICQIVCRVAGQPKPAVGSGLLIGPRHVLTAAHVVWWKENNGTVVRPGSIEVTPGRNVKKRPFGTWKVADKKFPKEYTPGPGSCHDYALLVLEDTIGGRKFPDTGPHTLSYWGSREAYNDTRIEYLEPAKLRKQAVHVSGYPFDKCGYLPRIASVPGARCYANQNAPAPPGFKDCLLDKDELAGSAQFSDKGRILDLRSGGPAQYLIHDADTCKAQSGSPMWIQSKGKQYLVGIHTGEFHQKTGTCTDPSPGVLSDVNRGIRLDKNVLENIWKWIKEDYADSA